MKLFLLFLTICLANGLRIENGTRLIGGGAAVPHLHNYNVAILKTFDGETYSVLGGGSIYDENHVITSASLVANEDLQDLIVQAGGHNLYENEGTEQFQFVGAIIPHPEYNNQQGENDVAILLLGSPLVYNQYVQPLALAPSTIEPSGQCTIVGWGLDSSSTYPPLLQEGVVNILPRIMCESVYEEYGDSVPPIVQGNICARSNQGNVGSCIGDFGGPLKCTDAHDRDYLAGISLWNLSCGQNNLPTAFSSVSYFRDWIESFAKKQ